MLETPEATFRQGLENGEVRLTECQTCQARHFYPSVVCRACGSPHLGWTTSVGKGTIHACTSGGSAPAPVALVDLDEGPRVVATLRSSEAAIGARVQAVIEYSDLGPRLVFEAVA